MSLTSENVRAHADAILASLSLFSVADRLRILRVAQDLAAVGQAEMPAPRGGCRCNGTGFIDLGATAMRCPDCNPEAELTTRERMQLAHLLNLSSQPTTADAHRARRIVEKLGINCVANGKPLDAGDKFFLLAVIQQAGGGGVYVPLLAKLVYDGAEEPTVLEGGEA